MANKVQKCPLIVSAWVAIDRGNSSSSAAPRCPRRRDDKVVVIMGPTCTGKCRLSIDLATRFPSSIISNKMDVYKGLNITTYKISAADAVGRELLPVEFRSIAGISLADPVRRELIPIVFRISIATRSHEQLGSVRHLLSEFDAVHERIFTFANKEKEQK